MNEIDDITLKERLSSAYLEYSISVIVDRAVPDFRDGLKPVARRLLYAMYKMGLKKSSPHKKCARIVGEVLGKFHPHSDCLRGNTKIYSLEGKIYEIKDLLKNSIWVLSYDEKNKKIIPTKAHSFRIGQYTNKIYKIEFIDGSIIETTSNHQLFDIKNGWIKAEEIQTGNMILNAALRLKDYPYIMSAMSSDKNICEYVHHLVGKTFYKKAEIYHHINQNIINNNLENIKALSKKEHNKNNRKEEGNGRILKSTFPIIETCIKEFGINFSIDNYEFIRKKKCKELGLGFGNINNRCFAKFDTLKKRLKINSINDLLKKISESVFMLVKNVEIFYCNNEPMYDFTVDKYHNMFVPIKVEKEKIKMILVHNSAAYGALVRLAQDFNMLYPLIDGQGSFGTIDDGAAAMRYTEARLESISELLLADLEYETVDFIDNFDGSLKEPVVLPARYPNLLVNGTSGIAVGMKTDIPSHNLGEIIDALILLIDKPKAELNEILNCVKGPDFPTGGLLSFDTSKEELYSTGRGTLKLRAKIEELDVKRRNGLQITELPYQVSKEKVMEQIIKLIKEKRIEGVLDLRDETDRTGMKIVIEFSRKAEYDKVVKQLYSKTKLEDSVSFQFLAIDKGPRLFNLQDYLKAFINFRIETTKRYLQFKIAEKNRRRNILEGYKKVIDKITSVVRIIRKSNSNEESRKSLMEEFDLNKEQADAILGTILSKLSKHDENQIKQELKELNIEIRDMEGILESERKLLKYIKEDLLETKQKYGKKRQTKILK